MKTYGPGVRPLVFGTFGAVIAAICCATPVLVVILGALGLSALTAYFDLVLLPALAISIGLVAYGLYKQRLSAADRRATDARTKTTTGI